MDGPTDVAGRLVLLVDPDPATRLSVRPLLIRYGLELIRARTTVAALELRAQLEDALAGVGSAFPAATVTPAAVARAQAEFAVSGNLLEAARELARGMPGEAASGW